MLERSNFFIYNFCGEKGQYYDTDVFWLFKVTLKKKKTQSKTNNIFNINNIKKMIHSSDLDLTFSSIL